MTKAPLITFDLISAPILLAIAVVLPFFHTEAEANTSPKTESRVVAEGTGIKITVDELNFELTRKLGTELTSFDEISRHDLMQNVLSRMIDRRLLVSAASFEKIKPSDSQVETLLQQVSATPGGDLQFSNMLGLKGISAEDFKNGLREDLAIDEYLKNRVLSSISVTSDEALHRYQTSPTQFQIPEEVKARHILFKIAPNADQASRERIRLSATELLIVAKKEGADFVELARKHSQAPNRSEGGELGWFTRNQFPAVFSEAAFSLQPNGISDLVETEYGFHIIKVEEKRGGQIPPFNEVQNSALALVRGEKEEKALKEHLEKLWKESKVILYLR